MTMFFIIIDSDDGAVHDDDDDMVLLHCDCGEKSGGRPKADVSPWSASTNQPLLVVVRNSRLNKSFVSLGSFLSTRRTTGKFACQARIF